MAAGAHPEARWLCAEPRRTLSPELLERVIQGAFPRSHATQVEPLTDGWRNANFKLQLDRVSEPVVLRIYEHDPSLCQKEIDLIRLVNGSVPVPEVLYAEPLGSGDISPFAIMRYVEGISLWELKKSQDARSVAQAAHAAGETLASIGRTTFSKPGWITSGPTVTQPLCDGTDPVPQFVDLCLGSANLQRRMPTDLQERVSAVVWSRRSQLSELDNDRCLVHGDFGKRNLLMRIVAGKWAVAAVLDWEFAASGSVLADVGHFLRYERSSRPMFEPHFSQGYQRAGGTLPQEWRRLARLIDLVALCESLTHDHLPEAVSTELVELVRATVEDRDPP